MRANGVVDRIIQQVIPGLSVERSVLEALLRDKPRSEALVPLLGARDPAIVRAGVLYLGLYGTMRDVPVLILCLHHDDDGVVKLAEHCVWSIWMQAGGEQGRRYLETGIACLRTGQYEDALRVFQALINEDPFFAEAHFQRGLALATVDRHPEAVAAYRQALELNPYHFGAASALGHAHIEGGDLSAALESYRRALKLHPRLEDVVEAAEQVESLLQRR